jgi:hypothetical protein
MQQTVISPGQMMDPRPFIPTGALRKAAATIYRRPALLLCESQHSETSARWRSWFDPESGIIWAGPINPRPEEILNLTRQEPIRAACIAPMQLYEHYKGGIYLTLFEAQESHGPDSVITYVSVIDGRVWSRPSKMFADRITTKGFAPRFRRLNCEQF